MEVMNGIMMCCPILTCLRVLVVFVPRTTEPLASTVDFFQPLFLEKLTLERPTIEIERGTAEFIDGPEGTDIATYRRISKTSHSYEDVYVKGNKKFATEQELRNVVSSLSCIRSDDRLCNAAFAFIEAVTGTRVPEEYELGLLTKENLKNVLTLSKLESIDFAKEMKKLEKEVKKPRSKKEKIMYEMNKGKSWVKMVPETAVRRLGGSSKGMSIRTLPEGKKREKNDEEEWYDSFFDFEGFCPKYFDALRARAREIVKSPPKSRTRMISAYTTSQVAALFDRSTSKKKGDERSRFTSRRGTEVSPTQITNFLLVDSLLAVTEAKYSDLLAAGKVHKLQRRRMPIFAVCGKNITWKPLEQSQSKSAAWLSNIFRFKVDGFEHSSFEYRTLDELNDKEDLSEDSQCAILALVGGIAEEGFKELTRRYLGVIIGIFTREQMATKKWSNYEGLKDASGRYPVRIGVGVDPWVLVSHNYSSSLTLGQLFDEVANFVQKNGSIIQPEDTARRPSSKRSRSSRRSDSETWFDEISKEIRVYQSN